MLVKIILALAIACMFMGGIGAAGGITGLKTAIADKQIVSNSAMLDKAIINWYTSHDYELPESLSKDMLAIMGLHDIDLSKFTYTKLSDNKFRLVANLSGKKTETSVNSDMDLPLKPVSDVPSSSGSSSTSTPSTPNTGNTGGSGNSGTTTPDYGNTGDSGNSGGSSGGTSGGTSGGSGTTTPDTGNSGNSSSGNVMVVILHRIHLVFPVWRVMVILQKPRLLLILEKMVLSILLLSIMSFQVGKTMVVPISYHVH